MAKVPEELSTISLHLSRVLDEIGLNELTVKERRETCLFQEYQDSIYTEIFLDSCMYLFGSQSEGSTLHGVDSDIDHLTCNHTFNIIQDLTEWTEGKINCLMLRDSTAPGYCRLQLMKPNIPEPEDTLPTQFCTYDECKRVILKNSLFEDSFQDQGIPYVRNGPAMTLHTTNLADSDITQAYMCTSRLEASGIWARRTKCGGWPNLNLIQQVVDAPFFLVPVGNRLSLTKTVEWRISTSLAERYLMFSLTIVQIKCYVILKVLMKTFVTPKVENSISSYHCKTALLYCIESTDEDFWREDNLIQCITRCLEMLLDWVTDEFCPHFILAEANLYAGKVTSVNKGTLQYVLHYLIQCTIESLLCVSVDWIGLKLLKKLGTKPNGSPILDSMITFGVLGYVQLQRHWSFYMPFFYMYSLSCNLSVAISTIRKVTAVIESRTTYTDELQQKATEQVSMFLYNLLGSFIASLSLGQHVKIPQEVIKLFDISATSDISFLLKQASVFYCNGDVEKVEQLCKNIDGRLKRNIVFPVCQCYPHTPKYSANHYQMMYTMRRKVRYAQCVEFISHEIHCVPQALRYEMFRAVGDDMNQRTHHDIWMFRAVVDCLPFLHYLQYLTYRALDKDQHQSLHKLERCIVDDSQLLCHVETAWNILGQCYEMEKQPVAALHCYRKSLDIRPRNNAANWLVPLLLYRYTRTR